MADNHSDKKTNKKNRYALVAENKQTNKQTNDCLSISFNYVAPDFFVFHIPYCDDYYANYYPKQRINIKVGNKETIVY